jgi:hypothetical protein
MLQKIILISTAIIFLFAFNSCSSTELTEPAKKTEGDNWIKVNDAASVELWLKITGSTDNTTILIKRDGKEILNIPQPCKDSVICDKDLTPGKTYSYQAFKMVGAQTTGISLPVTAATLGLTSDEFTWQTWKFGQNNNSAIYDIAVITENDIWAVGQIYMNDSTGQTPNMYNAIHWNGSKWELKKILFRDYWNYPEYFPIRTVLAFSNNNVWFASPENLVQWNGDSLSSKAFFDPSGSCLSQVNKMWGTNENNIYCVGDYGMIYHYTGSNMQEIESGTTLSLRDIKGCMNEQNNLEIYAVGSNTDYPFDKMILSINDNTATNVSVEGIPFYINGIWFKPGSKSYTVGCFLYEKNNSFSDNSTLFTKNDITKYTLRSIDGQALNDIAACGSYGELLHYNGKNWQSYHNLVGLENGEFYCIKIKNNFIIAAGYNNNEAVITIGRR